MFGSEIADDAKRRVSKRTKWAGVSEKKTQTEEERNVKYMVSKESAGKVIL